jgi:hypothetical protein
MKVKDILCEGIIPADFVKEADENFDSQFNSVAQLFKDKNQEHYEKYFKEFYESGIVPVFEKPGIDTESEQFNTRPESSDFASAGSRGLDLVKSRIKN